MNNGTSEAELKRLREACSRENDAICQTLGAALGYPRFCDDQKNFPGATPADGVFVGEHVAATLAQEAAERLGRLASERDEARAALSQACKVIDDRGICERDASAPLPDRLDRIIVELRTDRHHAEMEAVRLRAEVERLKSAVQAHHDQAGDDRCHLDDLKLYHEVLGEGVDPYVGALPPDADMEESCRRYIRQRRCPGGVVPLPDGMTIRQLTDEVKRLRGELKNARQEQSESTEAMASISLQRHSFDLERLEHERLIIRVTAELDRAQAERDRALAEVGCHHKPAIFDEHSREDLIRYGRKWLRLDDSKAD